MVDNTTDNPAAIAEAVKELNKTNVTEVTTVAPSNSEVILPGGFISEDGSVIKYAEVRELNGIDEEAISKAGSVGRALAAMLQRGVVSIGTNPVTKSEIDSLLSGDRDALLLGIRRVTFGDTIEFEFPCPHCKTDLDVIVDLVEDIPVKSLDDPINGRTFTYTSKKHGIIEVSLPTGVVQKKLIENSDKTVSELNTILLGGCIRSINGNPSLGATSALNLGMVDREAIVNEIIANNPGPRLGEVKTTCEACGEEIPMPLSLADLFRL
ncbi:MAG: hypothetical protein EBR82_19725 [Caulobacteraceae bacterium]|nr:hypothetical protein [Caulobacteraceae bacterium]